MSLVFLPMICGQPMPPGSASAVSPTNGDAVAPARRREIFKKYSQMKLPMKREALQKLNWKANEGRSGFDTEKVN